MTKEEYIKHTNKLYDQVDAGAAQSLAEHGAYLKEHEDPDHITLHGVQLLRNMRKDIKAQRVATRNEIAKSVPIKVYKKAQVLDCQVPKIL